MTTDREILLDLLGAARGMLGPIRGEHAPQRLDDAVARVEQHLRETPGRDCSAEVERVSRAAYAAGRNSGANS